MIEIAHYTSSLLKMLSHTQFFIWLIFGIQATKKRTVYMPTLFIIFVFLSLLEYNVFLENNYHIWMLYCVCVCLSAFLSYQYTSNESIKIIKKSMFVQVPGSYSTLIIMLLFFIIKYTFGYIKATDLMYYHTVTMIEISTSGLFSGYFLGKALYYYYFIKCSKQ